MESKRRYALVAALVAVALGIHFAVDWFTREPANYSQIEEGLYLGGYLRESPSGTTAVLNLCETKDVYQAAAHRWEPIRDAEPAPSLEWLHEQVKFIDAQRKAGRVVFVHCQNGISRSATVVLAYLMVRHRWSREEALAFLRSRRPGVRPNPAFIPLLEEWERGTREAKP